MKKNDLITVTVDGATAEGSGVAHPEGMAVFIKGAAVGDILTARVIKVNKKYAIAKIEKILTPSPDRENNDCAAFPACGGCAFRHITYAAEGRMKRQRVADAMKRIGGIDCEVEDIVVGEAESGYRNKAQYAVGMDKSGVKIGFYAERSHRIVNCKDCDLQPKIFSDILSVFEKYITENNVSVYDEVSGKGLLRNIYIRRAEKTEQIMVCAVINGDSLPNSEGLIADLKVLLGDNFKTFVLNINKEKTNVVLGKKCVSIYGDGYITDILCGVKVRLSALSFYQVNRTMAERLYGIASDFADCEGKTVLDLYCGAGTIGLSMANKANEVIGAEIVPEAVEDAKFNAAENGINNAKFICADAYEAAKQFSNNGIRPDVVVVDPPRKGLEEGLPTFIAESFCPESVVYVSCDPATLARDCAEFEKSGYKVKRIIPVDLFPRTHHVECVALIKRHSDINFNTIYDIS